MEFLHLHVNAFGALRDVDSGPDPLGRLVVVLGPNEAGKSTLFNFLVSMLYGIYPASRERNPHTPWGGGDIEGTSLLRMHDGQEWAVHRRLRSSPTGTLSRGGVEEELRNHTLACAEHVPRAVFRQVFALTLAELASLAGEGWEGVQDRLVSGMGTSDLASVRGAVDDLQREAGRLWRPNRQGHQIVRDLRERMRELRMRRRAAADADRRLRVAAEARDSVERDLAGARRELEACRVFLEECRTLLPVGERLLRIEELRTRAGPAGVGRARPTDPGARAAELEARVTEFERRLRELEEEAHEPIARKRRLGDVERALLDRSRAIREAAARANGTESLRARVRQIENDLEHLDRRCEETARELFDAPWSGIDREAVAAVPGARLRRALERLAEARETRRSEPSARAPVGPLAGAVLAASGALVLVVALLLGKPLVAVPAAVVAGAGAALLSVSALSRRTGGASEQAGPRGDDGSPNEVTRLLAGLPVRHELLARPGPELAGSIERLQGFLGDHRERAAELERLRRELGASDELFKSLASELGEEVLHEPAASVRHLDERLREAESIREGAAAAEREISRLERERARLTVERDAELVLLEELRDRLRVLAHADPGQGVAPSVRERLEALDRARRLEEEIEREHPDIEGVRERLRRFESGAGGAVNRATLAAERAREVELSARVEELSRQLEGLRKDMDYLGREESMGAVDGEIEAVRAELEDAVRARDRLWVIAALLREADRRFRDTHQPDVLRLAGCHLSAITGGRYRRVLLDDADTGRFLLEGPGFPGPVEVGEPISTGTREQVYLALRLAIVDHLDRRGERLPLFMDEAFVNWDGDRRERTFELLGEIARTRQVFVFTCHLPMAGELAARGARVIVLDPAG